MIPIALPPLRDRREDIPLLAEHFLAKYAAQMEKPIGTIAHETLELLMAHDWPGNLRELENAIERAVAIAATPTCCRRACRRACATRPAARWAATLD